SFLRSDVHYYRFQFSKSLLAAVARGDSSVVRWLLDHFVGCTAGVEVVEEAARCGRREIQEFFLEYGTVEDQADDERNAIVWGGDDMANAIEAEHGELARWLYEATPDTERNLSAVMGLAVRQGDMKLVHWLMGTVYTGDCRAREAVQVACGQGHLPVVQWLLERELVQYPHFAMGCAIREGHLDIVKYLSEVGITMTRHAC
ncbi:hypothetical protein PHYSODRAFT_489989, partial [Phytophthora sojae]